MSKLVYRLSFLFSIILIVVGLLFKIMHWPDSRIILLSGFGILGLIFAPFYFISKYRLHSIKLLKTNDIFGLSCLVFLSLGSILRILDFDISYYISLIGLIILVFLIIPMLLYIIIKFKDKRFKRILLLIFCFIYVLASAYLSTLIYLKPKVDDSFILIDKGINELVKSKCDKLNKNYTELDLKQGHKDIILSLRHKSDSLKEYIQNLKIEIINDCSESDSLLKDKLFKKGKAKELKINIDNYSAFIQINFSDYINESTVNNSLSTKVKNIKVSKSWEDEMFNHLPMVGVITILTSLQANIANVEQEITDNLKK